MRNVAPLEREYAPALLALILRDIQTQVSPKWSGRVLNFISLYDIEMLLGTKQSNVPSCHGGADYTT